MGRVKDLIVNIGASTKGLNKELGKANKAFARNFGNIARSGKAMGAAVGVPLLALGASSVKVFANFEQSMAKVKAVSGATGKTFKALSNDAKRLGKSTRFTATEVSGLQLEYSKLGFSTKEILNATEATLNLAQATGSDLSTAATVAGATLRGFGLDAEETGHLTDVMAKAFSSSALDMDKFAGSMKYVAPVAKAAGIGVEETTAMLALLADAGIKGSQAGTSLRRIFSELSADGKPLAEQFADLGKKGLSLADAKDEVGRSAQSALLILSSGADKIKPLTQELKNADGAAAGMAKTMDETVTGQMLLMKSAIEGAQLAIGESLAPTVTEASKKVAAAANWFGNLNKETQATTVKVGAATTALSGFAYVLPNVVKGLGMIRTAMMAMTTAAMGGTAGFASFARLAISGGPVAIAVAILVGGFVSLYGKVKRAREEVKFFNEEARNTARILKNNAAAAREYHEAVDQTATVDEKLASLTLPNLERALNRVSGTVVGFSEKLQHSIGQKDLDRIKELEKKYAGMNTFGVAPLQMALTEYRKELEKSRPPTIKTGEDLDAVGDSANKVAASVTLMKDSMKAGESLGLDPDAFNVGGLLGKLSEGTGGVSPMLAMFGLTDEQIAEADQKITNFALAQAEKAARFQESINTLATGMGAQIGAFISRAQEIKQALTEGLISPLEAMQQKTAAASQAMKGFVIDAIKGVIAMAKANVIANATSPTNVANMFSGGLSSPAFIIAGLSMLEGFLGNIPSLATGGLASSPQMAMVGDHANRSSSNPEVIAPLDKLMGIMGGGNLSATISGRDILLTTARDKNRSRRTFGSYSV